MKDHNNMKRKIKLGINERRGF